VEIDPNHQVEDAPGTVVGTVGYMSPEQAQGHCDKTDQRSDVFAIGAILYEFLTNFPPYNEREVMASLKQAQIGEVAPPQQVAVGGRLPSGLCQIAMRALEYDPARRHATVDELREDLERFLRGGSWFTSRSFPPGTIVIAEGDPADAVYIITRGQCEAYRTEGTQRISLRIMEAGDVFGESAIFDDRPRTATVVATSEVIAIEITRDALRQELCMDSWMGAFVRALANRLHALDRELRSLKNP
jgi:serine/threonine-protein kinase